MLVLVVVLLLLAIFIGSWPKAYDAEGGSYEAPIYRSNRRTGWMIGFEQVLATCKTYGRQPRRTDKA